MRWHAAKPFHIGYESYLELIDSNGIVQGTEYTFETSGSELEVIEDAVDSCPTRAIMAQKVIAKDWIAAYRKYVVVRRAQRRTRH